MPEQKKTILVTGANGQLGQEIIRIQDDIVTLIGLNRQQLDVTDLAMCRKVIETYSPSAIIHAGAYTAVDKAESEPDEAYRVNTLGTRNLAIAAREASVKLVLSARIMSSMEPATGLTMNTTVPIPNRSTVSLSERGKFCFNR